jgi:hypothetical protein
MVALGVALVQLLLVMEVVALVTLHQHLHHKGMMEAAHYQQTILPLILVVEEVEQALLELTGLINPAMAVMELRPLFLVRP